MTPADVQQLEMLAGLVAGRQANGPDYTTSLDAILRDVVPAMRERGWSLRLTGPIGSEPWLAEWQNREMTREPEALDPSPCVAVLRAMVLALDIATTRKPDKGEEVKP